VTVAENLHRLQGTALFLDVDVVIVGKLDGFFRHPGCFLVMKDYDRIGSPFRITGNSSVYRFELGAHSDLLAYLRADFDSIRQSFGREQSYPTDYMNCQGLTAYWPKTGVPVSSTTAFRPVPPISGLNLSFLRLTAWSSSTANAKRLCTGPSSQPAISFHKANHLGGSTLARVI
jgi:hypothetical protein